MNNKEMIDRTPKRVFVVVWEPRAQYNWRIEMGFESYADAMKYIENMDLSTHDYRFRRDYRIIVVDMADTVEEIPAYGIEALYTEEVTIVHRGEWHVIREFRIVPAREGFEVLLEDKWWDGNHHQWQVLGDYEWRAGTFSSFRGAKEFIQTERRLLERRWNVV